MLCRKKGLDAGGRGSASLFPFPIPIPQAAPDYPIIVNTPPYTPIAAILHFLISFVVCWSLLCSAPDMS